MLRPTLRPGTSLYLDLARISAAALVLLHHVFETPFYNGGLHFPGRAAVVTFFVISGFVIAYATDGVSNWRAYTVARFARIYSVALPALALTGALYFLGQALGPPVASEQYAQPWLRLAASLLFANQLWNLTIAALTNGPYWSLCYEVWYYVIFGVACFMRGWLRAVMLLGLCILVGPRILLLAPTWVVGWALYRLMKRGWALSLGVERLLFWCCLAAFGATLCGHNLAHVLSELLHRHLYNGGITVGGVFVFIGGDWRFPSDYLVALLFAGTVLFSRSALGPAFIQGRVAGAIRAAASYTFSIYLYHVPLLVFLHPWIVGAIGGATQPLATLAVVTALAVLLGRFTEHRKQPYAALARLLFAARSGVAARV